MTDQTVKGDSADSTVETIEIPKQLLVDLVDLWNLRSRRDYDSPNHYHSVPGVWDSDNGELACKPCAECALYNCARSLLNAEAGRIADPKEETE